MKQTRNQKNNCRKSRLLLPIALILIFGMTCITVNAQDHSMKNPDHIMVKPENVKWMDGPASLPPGAKFAVIEGDPKVAGLFTMRLWFRAGFKIPAH